MASAFGEGTMNVSTNALGRVLAFCACIVLIFPATTWAQATNSADVTGSVTDPSGAVVPDVAATVRDLDKNVERAFLTNSSGVYDTGPLIPTDRYLIIFKKGGFA